MSIDRESRVCIAKALEDYLEGKIDNYALDDVLGKINTSDVACQEIASETWFFYDDCSRHFNSGRLKIGLEDEQSIRRWIELLRSSTDWIWEKRYSIQPSHGLSGLLSRFRDAIKGKIPAQRVNKFWPWSDENGWRLWLEVTGRRQSHD